MHEFQLRELFKLYCGLNGAPHEAYSSVCGCGPHAAILHYTVNKSELNDGDLVLCDMGCRVNGYTADITCTFPVNGKFTKKQRDVYSQVLFAQKTASQLFKPGKEFDDIQDTCLSTLCAGLRKLGILRCNAEVAMDNVRNFCTR